MLLSCSQVTFENALRRALFSRPAKTAPRRHPRLVADQRRSIKRSHSAFDEQFGTDTERIVHLWQLDIDSPNRDDGTRYQPVDPDLIRAAIEALPIGLEDFVFIDLGSGKGRTLLLASEYPFKRERHPGTTR
jgi:hypothetical protein